MSYKQMPYAGSYYRKVESQEIREWDRAEHKQTDESNYQHHQRVGYLPRLAHNWSHESEDFIQVLDIAPFLELPYVTDLVEDTHFKVVNESQYHTVVAREARHRLMRAAGIDEHVYWFMELTSANLVSLAPELSLIHI